MFTILPENNGTKELISNNSLLMLVSSIVLAICYDALIAQPAVAVSYPIFFFAVLAMTYGNNKDVLVRRPSFGWYLVLPLVALTMTRFLFANEVLGLLNSLAVPLLFVGHVLLVTDNNRHQWFRFGFLKDIAVGLSVRPFKFAAMPVFIILALGRQDGDTSGRAILRKVTAGVLLSLPVLVIVVVLLSSADQVFEFFVRTFLAKIDLVEMTKHSLLIGVITPLAFSFLWGLSKARAVQVSPTDAPGRMDEIIVISGLSVLAMVYVLFSVIQFSYLFGGFSNHLPHGLSYANYARRGFFELVVVALLNTAIIVGSINCAAISRPRLRSVLQVLNSTLLLSTFIMLLSAHYRMSLYEESFSYTYLRVFTHAFMAMIFILLCATLYRVWSNRINLAKWYIVIGLVAYVLVNYANVDAIIARKNVERYYRTGLIDVDYLAGLSWDAVPYLVELTRVPDSKIALAACRHIAEKQELLAADRDWQGYNLSERRAKIYLTENIIGERIFESSVWKDDKYQRAAMIYNFLTTQNLNGKTQKEILALLGDPEFGVLGANYYAWPLWSNASPQGYDKVLWIRFKSSGQVDVFSIQDR